MISADGEAKPSFAEGRKGQALHLDGSSAMRSLLDLHPEGCPKLTISAWIKVLDPDLKGAKMVIGTGAPRSPGLKVARGNLSLNGPISGLRVSNVFRQNGGWVPVAGVYDFEGGMYTLHWQNRSKESELSDRWTEPEAALWVGAMNDRLSYAASGILIDELRITGRALDHAQVLALRQQTIGGGAGKVNLPSERPTRLPGDMYDQQQLPGDMYDQQQLPGDMYDQQQLPGDMYDQQQLPGDMYDQQLLPADEQDSAAARTEELIDLPKPDIGDQAETTQLPADEQDSAAARTEELIDLPKPDIGEK
jgi:hypothetical protein